jgi:hypothetical protein
VHVDTAAHSVEGRSAFPSPYYHSRRLKVHVFRRLIGSKDGLHALVLSTSEPPGEIPATAEFRMKDKRRLRRNTSLPSLVELCALQKACKPT